MAQVLKNSFTNSDTVARIGGDEFAIIIPGSSVAIIESRCRCIQEKTEQYNQDNPTVPISLSIGYAISQELPWDKDSLYKEADYNMYREKMHRHNSTRSAIVRALMKALEVRDIPLELQVIIFPFLAEC